MSVWKTLLRLRTPIRAIEAGLGMTYFEPSWALFISRLSGDLQASIAYPLLVIIPGSICGERGYNGVYDVSQFNTRKVLRDIGAV